MVRNLTSLPDASLETVTARLVQQRLTEHVLRDLEVLGAELLDIVIQDEFTHDWVVQLPEGLVLVYDTT